MLEGRIDLQVDVAVAAPPKLKGGSDGKEGPDDGAVVFVSAGLVPNRLFVVEVMLDAAAVSGLGPNRPPAEVEAAVAGVLAPEESLLAKSPPPKRFAWAGAVVVVVVAVEGTVLGGLGRFAKRPPAAGVPVNVI